MVSSLQVLLSGVALGLSIAAPPGPVTALAAQRVVARSWFSGWTVMFGATVADGVFFILSYFGVARLVTVDERGVLFIAGGALMAYLAFTTVRRAKPSAAANLLPRSSTKERSPFLLGLTIGLTNPYQLGWWVAIGAGMVAEFGGSIAVGFFVGIIAWTVLITAIVHASVSRYERLEPAIAYASAGLMALFAWWFLLVGILTFY